MNKFTKDEKQSLIEGFFVYPIKDDQDIDEVFERECPTCGCEWLRCKYQKIGYVETCEICGYVGKWSLELVNKGKQKRKK